MPRGLINTRILVVAGACLATLLGSFALSRPDSAAEDTRVAPLPPARVVGTVAPSPLPELGDAQKLPALRREAPPHKARPTPAPAIVAPAPAEPDEFAEPEPEPVVPAPVPASPAPAVPAPVAPSPPVNTAPEPEPDPPPVYLDDSG